MGILLDCTCPNAPSLNSSPSTRPPRTAANRHLTINTHPSCDPLCMGVVAEPARSARTRAHMQACTQMHQPIHTLERQPFGPWPATSRIHIASLCKPHLMRTLVYEWPASYTNGQPRIRMVSLVYVWSAAISNAEFSGIPGLAAENFALKECMSTHSRTSPHPANRRASSRMQHG